MTERFQAELAARGRDCGLIRESKRAEMTRDFLAQDNQNVIVFYPLYEGDLPISTFGGQHD
jgi:hypothetical protein